MRAAAWCLDDMMLSSVSTANYNVSSEPRNRIDKARWLGAAHAQDNTAV